MDSVKSSISLNLSNQANYFNSKKSSLSQFNFFVILGLDYLDPEVIADEDMPISININKNGELTINGLDGEIVNDQNMQIYSDRKVTTSDE